MSAQIQRRGKKNPGEELLIFGNPRKRKAKRRNAGTTNHKPGCACFACKFKRGERPSPGKRKNGKRPRAMRRRNAVSEQEQAVKLFQDFHGKDPTGIVEAQRSAAMRLDYTALGDLVAVGFEVPDGWSESRLAEHWDQLPHLGFEGDEVKLASSANGKQLYAIGGNQNLDRSLEAFEVDTSKDLIDLGEAAFVVYFARKAAGDFQPVEWTHKLGGKNGQVPRLGYDKLRKEIFFSGGEYHVAPEGITN